MNQSIFKVINPIKASILRLLLSFFLLANNSFPSSINHIGEIFALLSIISIDVLFTLFFLFLSFLSTLYSSVFDDSFYTFQLDIGR